MDWKLKHQEILLMLPHLNNSRTFKYKYHILKRSKKVLVTTQGHLQKKAFFLYAGKYFLSTKQHSIAVSKRYYKMMPFILHYPNLLNIKTRPNTKVITTQKFIFRALIKTINSMTSRWRSLS